MVFMTNESLAGGTRSTLTDRHFSAAQQQSSCLVLNPSSFPQHNGPCGGKEKQVSEINTWIVEWVHLLYYQEGPFANETADNKQKDGQ